MTESEALVLLRSVCEDVLESLYSLREELTDGSAHQRLFNFKEMLREDGKLDKLKDKLIEALTKTHFEAIHGNISGLASSGMGKHSYPCPNGCPRDAGEYCSRHRCQYCNEILQLEDGLKICKVCVPDNQ